jgi:hypothetical protein
MKKWLNAISPLSLLLKKKKKSPFWLGGGELLFLVSPGVIQPRFTMSDNDAAVEMETKIDKKPVAKRRKSKATAATSSTPAPSDPKKKATKGKAEPVESISRQSVESVRYESDDAERGMY